MKSTLALALSTLLPMPRDKQRQIILPPTEEPNLGPAGAIFFAWLLKNGKRKGRNKLSICKIQWERTKEKCDDLLPEEDCEFEEYMDSIGENIMRTTWDHGVKFVQLTSRGTHWAEQWVVYYRTYRGHHDDNINYNQ